MIDSSQIVITKPSLAKEDKVFSDTKLKYDKSSEVDPNIFSQFLYWLSKKLFNNVGAKNIYRTRQIVIWAIIILSVIVVVRLILRSELVGLTKDSPKSTAFNFLDILENLNEINFDKRILEAANTGDYRLATRWSYLKTVYQLDKVGLIRFTPFKTNIDYSYELKDKSLLGGFTALSRIYEYVWYGQFSLNEANYIGHAREFEQFEKKINV